MKNFIFLSGVLILLLVGCQQPTVQEYTDHVLIVKDSLWNTVKTVPFKVARDADLEDVQAEADAHNFQTIDDFWRVYIDEAPPLGNSPNVTVFVCNPENNNVNSVWLDIPRGVLVTNIVAWKASFPAQVLYIDHVPPAPIQDKDVNPYAWYALTIVDNDTGAIVFVDHCGFLPDQSFDSGGLIARNAVDQYYSIRLSGFNAQVQSPVEGPDLVIHPSCRVVIRQVYVVPNPIP